MFKRFIIVGHFRVSVDIAVYIIKSNITTIPRVSFSVKMNIIRSNRSGISGFYDRRPKFATRCLYKNTHWRTNYFYTRIAFYVNAPVDYYY
jgi:hypothetical protein